MINLKNLRSMDILTSSLASIYYVLKLKTDTKHLHIVRGMWEYSREVLSIFIYGILFTVHKCPSQENNL
jgi:hypothetical protein